MRKIFTPLVISSFLCILAAAVLACAPGTTSIPSSSVSDQPPTPVTVTATIETTKTITPPPSIVVTTISPSVTPKVTPVEVPEYQKANNTSFFIDKYTNSSTPAMGKDGRVTSVPVYMDVFAEYDLGGFFTDRDALLLSQIPSITSRDDWIYMFNMSGLILPVTFNLGYKLNPDYPGAKFEFFLLYKGYFTNNYEQAPFNIDRYAIDKKPIISTQGIHSYKINATGDLVAVIRTNDAKAVDFWWIKYGGKRY